MMTVITLFLAHIKTIIMFVIDLSYPSLEHRLSRSENFALFMTTVPESSIVHRTHKKLTEHLMNEWMNEYAHW